MRRVGEATFAGGAFTDLSGLEALESAEYLGFGNGSLLSLSGLSAPVIGQLIIVEEPLEDLSGLEGARIDLLSARGTLARLDGIENMSVRQLMLTETGVDSLLPLAGHQLRSLRLDRNPGLTSLAGIDPTRLELVRIRETPIASLAVLQGTGALQSVDLAGLAGTVNLSFLEGVQWIESFGLFDQPAVDLSTLPTGPIPVGALTIQRVGLTSLQHLDRLAPQTSVTIRDNTQLPECTVQAYFTSLRAGGYTGTTTSRGNATCGP